MWILLALLSAAFAALVAIFGKIGVARVDPLLATTVRGVIMAAVLVLVAALTGKLGGLAAVSGRAWWYIVLAGLAGAASWVAYFFALRSGPASGVAALDRLSVVFVLVLAVILLGEALTWKLALGGAMIVAGALFIVL